MKNITASFVLLLVTGISAYADDVDFYRFKTKHSQGATEATDFKIQVQRVNRYDPEVDDKDRYSCTVFPNRPDVFFCSIKKSSNVAMHADKQSALWILETVYGLDKNNIVEFEAEQNYRGYYAVMKNNDIWHVVMPVPNVIDDSMECLLSVVYAKSDAAIRCWSEYDKNVIWEVRGLKVSTGSREITTPLRRYNMYVAFGFDYDSALSAHWSESEEGKAQSLKVRQALDGIFKLKKRLSFAVNSPEKSARGFRLYLGDRDKANATGFFQIQRADYLCDANGSDCWETPGEKVSLVKDARHIYRGVTMGH